MVGICYTCVTVPFRLSMSRPADGGWLVFEAIVSLIFLSDVCFHFNTAFENDSGTHYVIHRPSIAKNYIQGWFLIDLSSSLPLELVELLVDDPDAFFSSGVGPVGNLEAAPRAAPAAPAALAQGAQDEAVRHSCLRTRRRSTCRSSRSSSS